LNRRVFEHARVQRVGARKQLLDAIARHVCQNARRPKLQLRILDLKPGLQQVDFRRLIRDAALRNEGIRSLNMPAEVQAGEYGAVCDALNRSRTSRLEVPRIANIILLQILVIEIVLPKADCVEKIVGKRVGDVEAVNDRELMIGLGAVGIKPVGMTV
jgi:hypothetical protein